LDEEPPATVPIKEPTQPGEQSPIGRPEGRLDHLATEHDEFDGQILVVTPTEAE
jgi:hypothetical protein